MEENNNHSENIDNINIIINVPSQNNESDLSSNNNSRNVGESGFYGSKLDIVE